jgi:hypothetical protein
VVGEAVSGLGDGLFDLELVDVDLGPRTVVRGGPDVVEGGLVGLDIYSDRFNIYKLIGRQRPAFSM